MNLYLMKILLSKSIKEYLNNKKLFEENNVKIVNDDNLIKEYKIFLEKMNDINFMKNIIYLIYLPEKIRAFVNHNQRIFLNCI